MKRRALVVMMTAFAIAACHKSASDPATRDAAKKPIGDRRCLPAVSVQCGCSYACGVGERDGEQYRVRHPFWKDTELRAKVTNWCAKGKCTDAFDVALDACDITCIPSPADSSCHFDESGACVGASASH